MLNKNVRNFLDATGHNIPFLLDDAHVPAHLHIPGTALGLSPSRK